VHDLISELENRLEEPTAKGLAQAVSRAIREGVLESGDRLPPIRQLGHELALSPTTVSAAWGLLVRAGTIKTAGRRGTVVTDVRGPRQGRYRQAVEHGSHYTLDLSTGAPDPALLPSLDRALQSIKTLDTRESYLDEAIFPDLQNHLLSTWPCEADQLAVADGAMDALELVIRSSLTFGDRVVVENPTFRALVDLLEFTGIQIVGVRSDSQGIVPGDLAAALAGPVAAVFLQPRAHNPTGVSMTPGRSRALAQLLRGSDALVVEDDSVSALSISPQVTLGRLLPQRTVHIRSYSKSHGPDLRLAVISGPDDLLGRVRHLRQLGQGWSSRLLQRVLLHLLTDEKSSEQVAQSRAEYARRQRLFSEVLAEQDIHILGRDGLNAWVPVRDEAAALMRLAAQGIGAAPGSLFKVEQDSNPHIRVTVGLIDGDLPEVAARVALAARSGGWGPRAR
jgi:DNA-binding transcriptional MocR family regulator